MKLVLILLATIAIAAVNALPKRDAPTSFGPLDEEWEKFKKEFDKTYEDAEEEKHRKGVFADQLKLIIAHNKRYNDGKESYFQGITQFTDLTGDEFGR